MSTWAHKTMYLLYPYDCHSHLTNSQDVEGKKETSPARINKCWMSVC